MPSAGDARLLLRRVIDAQGKSRAWVNGSSATVAQLREVADHLVDIHGQHAWQSLTRPPAVRALLDAYAGIAHRRPGGQLQPLESGPRGPGRGRNPARPSTCVNTSA